MLRADSLEVSFIPCSAGTVTVAAGMRMMTDVNMCQRLSYKYIRRLGFKSW